MVKPQEARQTSEEKLLPSCRMNIARAGHNDENNSSFRHGGEASLKIRGGHQKSKKAQTSEVRLTKL